MERGDLDGALKSLTKALEAGARPALPTELMGGYRGFLPIPEGKAKWEVAVRKAVRPLEASQNPAASASLVRAMVEARDEPDAFFYFGLSCLARDEPGAASGSFSKGLSADLKCWPCWLGRSVALELEGNLPHAATHLKHAGELAIDEPAVAYYLARQAIRKNLADRARQFPTTAMGVKKKARADRWLLFTIPRAGIGRGR